MKRVIAAAIATLLTFGGVYGLAASLSLTSGGLGAATVTVAACQAGALTASYTPAYSATTPGYTLGTVTVSGLASTCYTKAYRITLAGAANASLGEVTGTTPSVGSTFAGTFSPVVDASLVTSITIVVSG